jgi:hypothetical protein
VRQIVAHSSSEFIGRKAHPTQHPFNNVAVMAKQPSWFAAVVAMICPHLFAFETFLTNGAPIFLRNKEIFNLFRREASASLTLCGKTFSPSFRVFLKFHSKLFGAHLSGFGSSMSMSTTFRRYLRLGVVSPASGLHVGTLVISALALSLLVETALPALPMIFKVLLPLFGAALGFALLGRLHGSTNITVVEDRVG